MMNYAQALALTPHDKKLHNKKFKGSSYLLAKPKTAAVGVAAAKTNTKAAANQTRKSAAMVIEKMWRGHLARLEAEVWKHAKTASLSAKVAAQAVVARNLELARLKATLGELRAGRKPSVAAVVRGDLEKLRVHYGPALATIVRGFQSVARRRAQRWRERVVTAVAAAKEAQAAAAAEVAQGAAKTKVDAAGAALKMAAAQKRSESLELLCGAPCARTPQQRSHSSLLDSRWCS